MFVNTLLTMCAVMREECSAYSAGSARPAGCVFVYAVCNYRIVMCDVCLWLCIQQGPVYVLVKHTDMWVLRKHNVCARVCV